MNKKEPEAFAKEAAKGIKAPQDLNEFCTLKLLILVALSG
jgi:hypothetical protein